MSTINSQYNTEKQKKIKIIDWLIEHFPAAFFKKPRQVKPLKVGILEDVIDFYDRLDTPPFSKRTLRSAFTYYCTSPAYLNAQKINKARIDLYGNEMELVTAEQAKYAKQRYERQYLMSRNPNTTTAFEQPTDNSPQPAPPAALPSE
ncbi:MAG: ProQ/FinO family protein [Gammaproteobacteria bacterium]|nr:ProQ/FinO family protein [Gammaproteobacteria bacterium]